MPDIPALIDHLAADAARVHPLSPPGRRTMAWLALVLVVVSLTIAVSGLRTDLAAAMAAPLVALEWTGSVLTGLTAAYATFQISIPGRSRRWAWLPVVPSLLWLGAVGTGCALELMGNDRHALLAGVGQFECAKAITLVSLPLGLTLLVMVRHAGVVRPGTTALLGSVAASALAAATVSLVHEGEAAVLVLLWHLGAVAALSLASWLLHRRLFAWLGYAPA